MSRIKAAMRDPFSHRKVSRQGRQFCEQLHRTHLCDAWNADQQLISLAKQVVLSDECHRFAPKFVDTLLQRCHGALQILNNAARRGSRAVCRVKTVLILSALHRKVLDVANNRAQSH
jgi:hypothetical protein